MRKSLTNGTLRVRAIAGTYVVILAWDFAPGEEARHEGLLGFAIERTELKQGGAVVERYWMRSIKRFREKDRGLPPGTPVSTADHPIQSFQWGDYTAQAGRTYRYRIVPAYGTPKRLALDDAAAVTVEIATEAEFLLDPDAENDTSRHDIYFNRGVIGSQAYARQFENAEPDPTSPLRRKWCGCHAGFLRH